MSIAAALPIANLSVLALEPDRANARAITQVVSELNRVNLTVVRSKDGLLDELRDGLPDLVLLPALLSWSAEAELGDALRSVSETHHLEVLVTPFDLAHDKGSQPDPRVSVRWRHLVGRMAEYPKSLGCSARRFRERVEWALQSAQRARLHQAERVQLFSDLSLRAAHDRRAHRRFAGNKLPWLQTVRLCGGSQIRLVDLSAGGALVESHTRFSRDTAGLLELIGHGRESLVPFRVARWQPSSGAREFPYLGALIFTGEAVNSKYVALSPFMRTLPEAEQHGCADS